MSFTFIQDKIRLCCYSVKYNGKYIGSWCRKSKAFVTDGVQTGKFEDEDDMRLNLRQTEVCINVWGRGETHKEDKK